MDSCELQQYEKKPLLFKAYIGNYYYYTPQLYQVYITIIRIPIKQPGFPMESKEPPALALRGDSKFSTFPRFLQETVTGAVMSGMLLGLGSLGKWKDMHTR